MQKNTGPKYWLKPVILVLVILILIFLSRYFGLGHKIAELKNWIRAIGIWGIVVFIVIYAVSTLVGVPTSLLTVIAGSLYGSVIGIIIVSIALTLGATLGFIISRYFAQEAIHNWLKNKEKFRKLENLTRKHGASIVAITRLIPVIPYTLLNYSFGLTKIQLGTYVFWSWLSLLPGTVLYVVGVDVVTKMITEGRVDWWLVILFVFMIALIAALVNYVHRLLKHKENIA